MSVDNYHIPTDISLYCGFAVFDINILKWTLKQSTEGCERQQLENKVVPYIYDHPLMEQGWFIFLFISYSVDTKVFSIWDI